MLKTQRALFFHSVKKSDNHHPPAESTSPALQKGTFLPLKGALLQPETPPFRSQKVSS